MRRGLRADSGDASRDARAPPAAPGPRWSEVLRELREAQGATQSAWADWIGVGRRTLQRWEAGGAVPDERAEQALLAVCGRFGLFRRFDHGPLSGQAVTPEWLHGALADARLAERERRDPPRRPRVSPAARSGGRSESARPRGQAAPTNLPAELTRFIGREREAPEVRRLLASERLVTLTGVGGVGKTRLALQVAAALAGGYAGGVWLVELSPLADPALVPQAVAAALGVREQPGRALVEVLAQLLRPTRALLVLDNCEHLVGPCAALAEALLRACPRLTVLATSRQPLGVAGEAPWRVPSLSLPGTQQSTQPVTVEAALASEAVRLFVDRAARAHPGFALIGRTAAAVAEICRRLDGIPLAIELAAARAGMLSVEQIAARLDDRFALLTGGSRTARSRHRTLRGTLDWSHRLLSRPERVLFRRLAVFAGGWSLEAAEAVGAGGVVGPDRVVELLGRLVDQSLVLAEERSGAVRYRLLETVRQYAAERLREAGEADAVQRRHRDWCGRLADCAPLEVLVLGPAERAWLERMDEERDNLRAALRRSVEQREAAEGLRLAVALGHYWLVRGHFAEGRAWLDELLALPIAGAPAPARVEALAYASNLARHQGDLAGARAFAEDSLALARSLRDEAGIAKALVDLAFLAWHLEDFARGRALLSQALDIFRRLGNRALEAEVWSHLAEIDFSDGDCERAEQLASENVRRSRELGHRWATADSLRTLARVAAARGDYAAARVHGEESLALLRELGNKRDLATCLSTVAHAALNEGRARQAWLHWCEALRPAEDLGDGERELLARFLGELAGAVAETDPGRAVRLAAAAAALRQAIGAPPPSTDPNDQRLLDGRLAAARARLGEEASAAAEAEGRAMPLDQAVALALEDSHAPVT